MLKFVTENFRDFTPKLRINQESKMDGKKTVLKLTFEHKGNWVDEEKVGTRRNKFNFALKKGIKELGIEFC